MKERAISLLREGGLRDPARVVRLMKETIRRLELDLAGLTILTEAASGPYVVTPVIATLAGAQRVAALTRDSQYATAETVVEQTRALESLCDVESVTEIHRVRTMPLFHEADIVTNLGFVRPIDAVAITAMKKRAVVALMCEAWEVRAEDVDIHACLDRGVEAVGVNETYPGLDVMHYCSWLVVKLLQESQIEVSRSQIAVLSSDKLGEVTARGLASCGLSAHLLADLRHPAHRDRLAHVDALIVADNTRGGFLIGPGGDMTAQEVAETNPAVTIVPLAGSIDVEALAETGLLVHPNSQGGPHRMTVTLAELGPRPVIELHAAGLKTGQMALLRRMEGHPFVELMQRVTRNRVNQDLSRTAT